jgi:hypothetical protein
LDGRTLLNRAGRNGLRLSESSDLQGTLAVAGWTEQNVMAAGESGDGLHSFARNVAFLFASHGRAVKEPDPSIGRPLAATNDKDSAAAA